MIIERHDSGHPDLMASELGGDSIERTGAGAGRPSSEASRGNSERLYRSVFEQAAVGVARVGLDGSFLEVNDRFCAIAGYSRAEMLAGGFQQITHPDDLDADLAHVETLLAGEAQSYSMEKRYITKVGEVVWINLTVSLARDEAGKPDYFVSVIEDISARKRAEERQHLLINELNHRVKNTLAAVQSIASYSFKGADTEAMQAFGGRLAALSAAHNVLTRESWTGASLRTAIDTAIAPFGADRFRLVGDDRSVGPKMVISLSMVLHELATNAAKYGALSLPDGVVRIEWTVRQENGSERLAMRWEETGGPEITPPMRKGFGTRLVERQLALEFGGSVRLDYPPSGLVCTMDLSLPPRSRSDQEALEHAFDLAP